MCEIQRKASVIMKWKIAVGAILAVMLLSGIGFFNFGEKTVSNVSVEELGIKGLWKLVVDQTAVSDQARIHTFNTIISNQGEFLELAFHVIERSNHDYVYTRVNYDTQQQRLAVKRSSVDQWSQYNQQLDANYFFARLEEWKVLDLMNSGEYPFIQLDLLMDTHVNYSIEDRLKFGIDDKGLYVITNEQLPVQGYWLSTCGIKQYDEGRFSGCDNSIDYILDIFGSGRKDGQ